MSAAWSEIELALALFGCVLLLIGILVLSVALSSVAALSRVSLRRVASEIGSGREFLERLDQLLSRHRSSVLVLRQIFLVALIVLLALAARGAGWPRPVLVGGGLGVLLGVVGIQLMLAPLIAAWNPRRALGATAWAVRGARTVTYPIVEPVHLVYDWFSRATPKRSEEELEEEQDEEVEALIEVGEREGLLEAGEGAMMRSIVDLDETVIREIMTPRTDIVALPEKMTIAEARRTVMSEGHSRLPVFRGSIDNVVGVLHIRDLFQAWEDHDEDRSIAGFLRPAIFVPETVSAAELLSEMRQKMQLALVLDEYGGVAGLVTLEDLLEEIVGDIRDEHDEEEDLVRHEADGSWVISAVAHVKELETLFDIEFEEREFDTVGGLVVSSFGRVPERGERTETQGLEIEVLDADRRRVHSVRIRPTGISGARAGGVSE